MHTHNTLCTLDALQGRTVLTFLPAASAIFGLWAQDHFEMCLDLYIALNC